MRRRRHLWIPSQRQNAKPATDNKPAADAKASPAPGSLGTGQGGSRREIAGKFHGIASRSPFRLVAFAEDKVGEKNGPGKRRKERTSVPTRNSADNQTG